MTTLSATDAGAAKSLEQIAPNVVPRVRNGDLATAQNGLFAVGAIALIVSIAMMFTEGLRDRALFTYLTSFMFTLSIALGALIFVLIQHVTRAGWSVAVRRVAENMMATLPLFAVLILPIALGAHTLFHHWMDAGIVEGEPNFDPLIAHKSGYLNSGFFYTRMVGYFVLWTAMALLFRRWSLRQDESGDPALSLKMARVSAPCLLIFALTITFAAIDWIMSLDPHWFSTMFGVTYFAGSLMAQLGVLALVLLWLRGKNYLGDAVNTEHYHDIGKLMFAFMVFWAYVCFSQYMLIWYANLPEETLFYQHRQEGSWFTIGQIMVFGHFLVPFGFLMSRHIKRNRTLLAVSAVFLLVMHWLDMQFLIMPTLDHHGFHPHWLDATSMIGLVAIFLAATIRLIRKTPLVPLRDPRLSESLRFENI